MLWEKQAIHQSGSCVSVYTLILKANGIVRAGGLGEQL